MSTKRYLGVKILTFLGSLAPASAFAQVSEACGTNGNPLMYCTFDEGAKQVALCQTDGQLEYRFGANLENPELALQSDIADLGYVPYSWSTETNFESVVFHNGDTSYEVFSSLPRVIDPGSPDGGITVTLPGRAPFTLTCDTNSVEPRHPYRGIGQLGNFVVEGVGSVTLASCLVASENASNCLGVVNQYEVNEHGCIQGQDPTDCWAAEAAAWDLQLAIEFTIAIESVKVSIDQSFADNLQAAQISWHNTRERDCRVYRPLLFAQDGGAAYCHSEYAAARVDFLRDVINRSEFQG